VGTQRNVDLGLQFVHKAIEWGSKRAAAVSWYLHRAYGRQFPGPTPDFGTHGTDPAQPVNTAILAVADTGHTSTLAHFIYLKARRPYSNYVYHPLLFTLGIQNGNVKETIRKYVDRGWGVNQGTGTTLLTPRYYYDEREPDRAFGAWVVLEIEGKSLSPLRWAIMTNNSASVNGLLEHGAEFPLVPSADAYSAMKSREYQSDVCTAMVLDEPCYSLKILRQFLKKQEKFMATKTMNFEATQAPFAETPLGLIVMEPDSPSRRLRFGVQCLPKYLFPVLDLLRSRQPGSDAQLFWAAAMNGHSEVVKYLIKRGVDLDLRFHGMTPLHTAILYGQIALFKYLLKHGADARKPTLSRGMSAMHLVFWKAKPFDTEKYLVRNLLKHQVDISGSDGEFGRHVQPLHLAALNGRYEAVRFLLRHGADPTAILRQDVTTSVRVAKFTEWGIRRQAADKDQGGYDSYGRSKDTAKPVPITLVGCTALGIVLTRSDMFEPEIGRQLLWTLFHDGSRPSTDIARYFTRPDLRQTILHLLACNPTVGLARSPRGDSFFEAVLRAGADSGLTLDIPDADGDTPLHYACVVRGSRDFGMVKFLLNIGADGLRQNLHGLSPAALGRSRFLAHATSQGQADVTGRRIDTPLMLHVRPGNLATNWQPISNGRDPVMGGDFSQDVETWNYFNGATGLPRMEDMVGRLWEQVCKGFKASQLWDLKKSVWVRASVNVWMTTLQDPVGSDSLEHCYPAHVFVKTGDD